MGYEIYNVLTMYIDSSQSKQRGKTYTRHLLRQSYRENGKVKHRTIANLSHCSPQEIEAMKLALKHKNDLSSFGNIKEVEIEQGIQVGAVCLLKTIAERLGIMDVLGDSREGKLATWQIFSRLIDQGSRLSAVRLAQNHAACEVLGLGGFNEDNLYENLYWLSVEQERIEKQLFYKRYGKETPELFLYDVTSSYLEGFENILAAYGYNRDGKKGKKQLVIGLLTGSDGSPVAVRVFEGNTVDNKTVSEQVKILTQEFGVEGVTLVGDRGMLKQPQIENLTDEYFHYITAITKPQIRTLMEKGVIQLNLFEEKVCEVEHESVRYIFRRNPVRVKEMVKSREDRISSLQKFINEQNNYLLLHPQAKEEVALKKVTEKCKRYHLDGFIEVSVSENKLLLILDEEKKKDLSILDGCYVIKTDLPVSKISTETVHDRYKDLSKVERAFRTWKTGHLELRPVHVRTEHSTRGHVFVVMLAYLIERELERLWSKIDIKVSEGVDCLSSLCSSVVTIRGNKSHMIPKPNGITKQLLSSANVILPEVLPFRKVKVATRKKLTTRRNQ